VATDITQFLNSFSNDSKFALNLPVLWSVSIDGVTPDVINETMDYAGESWRAKVDPLSMTKDGVLLVAQEVTLPGESSSFTPMDSGSSMGGYLPGYALSNRSNFLDRSFSINFLETQMDLEHYFIRPWSIALAIRGLIENGSSLKSSIEVRQYSNFGKFIKGFKFKKAFPTNVEGFTLNYDNTDFPIKSVTFACQNYEQLTGGDYVGDVNITGGNIA
jgi:hypothetical protein